MNPRICSSGSEIWVALNVQLVSEVRVICRELCPFPVKCDLPLESVRIALQQCGERSGIFPPDIRIECCALRLWLDRPDITLPPLSLGPHGVGFRKGRDTVVEKGGRNVG